MIKNFFLNFLLILIPRIPPTKVLDDQSSAIICASDTILIISRQKTSQVLIIAYTVFTKTKLKMYPDTPGSVHTVKKFIFFVGLITLVLLTWSLLGISFSSVRSSTCCSCGEASGNASGYLQSTSVKQVLTKMQTTNIATAIVKRKIPALTLIA